MYEHKIVEFYGDPINFFVNDESARIGIKSIANSIGLSWSGFYEKLKRSHIWQYITCQRIVPDYSYKIVSIDKDFSGQIVSTIDKSKYSGGKREKIEKYQKEFHGFVLDSLECSEHIEKGDWYISNQKNIEQLLYDSIITLGNDNAITQVAQVLDPLLNKDINKWNADKIRLWLVDLVNPIYEMDDMTAMKEKEVSRIKSSSVSSRILEVADHLYDIDRPSYLKLKKIAKGIR